MSNIIIGVLIPFLGTALGSGLVFFMRKKEINKKVQKLLLGFAAGVMMAASIWSLLMPALDMTAGRFAWVPVAVGFMLGIIFLLILDTLVPHQHLETEKAEGLESNFKKTTKLVLAVTIHNIPEGMATGVVFAGVLIGNTSITIAGAIVLAVGMAIQNFPEGTAVSFPLRREGYSRTKAFFYGQLSGVVEPIAGIIGVLLVLKVQLLMPFLLCFAAGAMIYVVVQELIPESQTNKQKDLMALFTLIGFSVMMILDVALG